MTPRVPSDFVQRLRGHRAPALPAAPPARRAAVAAILRAGTTATEVLLMRRTEHPRDPWSGHVSFPGGNRDAGDEDLLATAVRETREEVGIELASAELLCRLDTIPAIARGRLLPMDITSYVFLLRDTPELVPSHEVAETFWLPLDVAAAGELDADHPYRDGEVVRMLPSWRYEGRTVWGLTYRMLRRLLEVIEA